MKYAFMTFSTPDWSRDEILKFAADIGYDGVEWRAAGNHKHGVELATSAAERAEIREAAADAGVANCCIATSVRYLDEGGPEKHIDDTLAFLELARDIACPTIRVFGGGKGKDQKGWVGPEQIDALAEILKTVAPKAEEAGVAIALETHDYWCNPKNVAKAVSRVNSRKVGVNWDIMHPCRIYGYTVEESFNILRPWVQHFHMHDGTANPEALEFFYFDEGKSDYDNGTAIQLLSGDGYSGYMSGEWFNRPDPRVDLPRELKGIRAIEARALAHV